MGELNLCGRGCIFDGFLDAGVAFLVPQTVWEGHLGRVFVDEWVAFSMSFMSQGFVFDAPNGSGVYFLTKGSHFRRIF